MCLLQIEPPHTPQRECTYTHYCLYVAIGSVKEANATELFKEGDIDGFLVGGASLSAAKFFPIIEAAAAAASQ